MVSLLCVFAGERYRRAESTKHMKAERSSFVAIKKKGKGHRKRCRRRIKKKEIHK